MSGEDRLFRLVLALALLPLMLVLDSHGRLIGLLGFEPLFAALLGWSPLYALFRVRAVAPAVDTGDLPTAIAS
jgi:hypothetical protein